VGIAGEKIKKRVLKLIGADLEKGASTSSNCASSTEAF